MGKEARAPIKVTQYCMVLKDQRREGPSNRCRCRDIEIGKFPAGKAERSFATVNSAKVKDIVYTVGFPGASVVTENPSNTNQPLIKAK